MQRRRDSDNVRNRSHAPWPVLEQTAAPGVGRATMLILVYILAFSSPLSSVAHSETARAAPVAGGGHPPSEFRSYISGLAFVDRRHCWVLWHRCSLAGTTCTVALARTDDGGHRWQHLPTPESALVPARHIAVVLWGSVLHFATSRDGWLAVQITGKTGTSQQVVLVTHDGGLTWRQDPRLAGVTMLVSWQRSTWAVTDNAGRLRLLTSDDSGHLWRSAAGHPLFDPLNQLRRVSRQVAFLGLLATHDGGTTWHRLVNPCGRLYFDTLTAVDAQHLWAVCEGEPSSWALQDKALFGSQDGGRHWSLQAASDGLATNVHLHTAGIFPIVGDGVRNFQMVTLSQGWAVFGNWWLLGTRDGGLTWTNETPQGAVEPDATDGLTSVFLNARYGWLATQETVYRTSDGGQRWIAVPLPAGG